MSLLVFSTSYLGFLMPSVAQDVHLSMRIRLALETNIEACLLVIVPLLVTCVQLMTSLTVREDGLSLRSSSNEVESSKSYPMVIRAWAERIRQGLAVTDNSAPEADDDLLIKDDVPWYMGKARERVLPPLVR
jgi:hypothetical protein